MRVVQVIQSPLLEAQKVMQDAEKLARGSALPTTTSCVVQEVLDERRDTPEIWCTAGSGGIQSSQLPQPVATRIRGERS